MSCSVNWLASEPTRLHKDVDYMQPVLDDLIILLTDRNFTDLTTPNKEKKGNKTTSSRTTIYLYPAEPTGLDFNFHRMRNLLLLKQWLSFHCCRIKITTATAVLSTWVWWQTTYISFIRPTPSEMGQEGMHPAMSLLCCSIQYGACRQHTTHWHTHQKWICRYSIHLTSDTRYSPSQLDLRDSSLKTNMENNTQQNAERT